ncbi:MAG: hypothetical protein KDB53_04590, partial [Planctomycetes bacterium]|nr:hypothetical protein [Planctomycetota bacterium]
MASLGQNAGGRMEMKQDERIETMLRSAARGFRGSLNLFYPSVGRNGFNERNITFQLAHAFVTAKGHAFFEVPFKAKGKHRTDNHFDACLFDERICVLVEAKRLYSSEKN